MSTLAATIGRGTNGARPAAGEAGRLYYDTTNSQLQRDNGSSWDSVEPSSLSNPMTTSQDIIVGGASGTPGRLAKGPAGANLSSFNGSLAWNGGTSFPASPATGDRYWRSDLGLEFYYDGTRWLSVELFAMVPTATTVLAALSASGNVGRIGSAFGVGTDLWLVSSVTQFFVASGGSALSASHKWVGTVAKLDTANNSGGTLDTINVDSGSSAAWRTQSTAIGALLGTAATYPVLNFSWAKTGTPGTLTVVHTLTCRLVQT